MSAGELWRNVTVCAIIAVAFGVVGYHLIDGALEMVGLFGASLGVDASSSALYAKGHRWVHLFAACCALAVGVFYYLRKWVLFGLAAAAVLFCGAYGILNMQGFAGSNRVTVAAVKDARRAAAEREYQAARTDLQTQIKSLEGWVKEAESTREKVFLAKQIDAKRRELSAIRAPVPDKDTVVSDTQAASLGALTMTDPKTWMMTLPLVFAVLVFAGESFSFVVVGHMVSTIFGLVAAYMAARAKPVQPLDTRPDRKAKRGDGDDAEGGGGGRTVQPLDTPESLPAGVLLNRTAAAVQGQDSAVNVSSEAPRVEVPAPSIAGPRTALQVARDYLQANPDAARRGGRALAKMIGVSKSTVGKALKEFKTPDSGRLGRVDHHREVRGLRRLGQGGATHAYPN